MVKWNKKYYLVCLNCSAGFPIAEGKESEAITLYTELADNNTSIDIHNKIDALFIPYIPRYVVLKETNEFILSTRETLKAQGYKEKHIDWILSVYLTHAGKK